MGILCDIKTTRCKVRGESGCWMRKARCGRKGKKGSLLFYILDPGYYFNGFLKRKIYLTPKAMGFKSLFFKVDFFGGPVSIVL